jgi:biotin carboxylase
MKQLTVWFNRGLSQTGLLINALKLSLQDGERVRILSTHVNDEIAWKADCDLFELEPDQGGEAYIAFALDFVRRHHVDVLIPHYHMGLLSGNLARFASLGCTVIVAGRPETIHMLHSKSALYDAVQQVGGLGIEVPPYTLATGPSAVMAALRQYAEQFQTLCFKPVKGIGGHGFRIVSALGASYSSAHNGDFPPLTMKEVEIYLTALVEQGEAQEKMMVMPYLDGPEYSVDCLAQDGTLIASVIRTKFPGGLEELIDNQPDLVEHSQILTALLQLSGLYNVQFLADADGRRYLLEINPRMAGGTHWGAFSGVLLPYWAIRLAGGTAKPEDIPAPKTGIRFHRKTRQILG